MKLLKSIGVLWQAAALLFSLSTLNLARAEDMLGYFTGADKYTGPTVEDNIRLMDTDKNGFADVFEVRAFLEAKHGKGYEKELLDKMESSARGHSCSTPFAKDLYSDQTPASQSTQTQQ